MANSATAGLWRASASTSAGIVRLAVISDDETLAERVIAALERDGLAVRLEAADHEVSALAAATRRPTVVVVGHQADRAGAEQVVRRARRRLPEAALIVVLPGSGQGDAARLLAAGADALVLDRDVDGAVAAAVRAVAAGQVCVPGELRHLIQPAALSHRERQILGLAVAGLTNAQIAGRLFIAESTVKTHLSSAFRRLGVHSRREAATLVFASDEVLRRSVLTTLRLSQALSPQREPQ
jgi:DNA-binding NarL/FixJ family response regulator